MALMSSTDRWESSGALSSNCPIRPSSIIASRSVPVMPFMRAVTSLSIWYWSSASGGGANVCGEYCAKLRTQVEVNMKS